MICNNMTDWDLTNVKTQKMFVVTIGYIIEKIVIN
jgi:hypothetical protein